MWKMGLFISIKQNQLTIEIKSTNNGISQLKRALESQDVPKSTVYPLTQYAVLILREDHGIDS